MTKNSSLILHKRLQLLRKILLKEKLHGYILPYGDEFQNEYLPPASKRFLYMTGFESSAGLALITKDSAALFVDGRYILKATKTIDSSLFNVWTSENIQEYLKNYMPPSTTLGYDPWTLTESQYISFKNLGDLLGFSLKDLSYNPVDALWIDRPPLPHSLIELYPLSFSGIDWRKKIEILCLTLKKKKTDVCILTSPESINWLLNIRGRDIPCIPIALCRAFVFQNGIISLFLDKSRVPSGLLEEWKDSVKLYSPSNFEKEVKKLAQAYKKTWYDPALSSVALTHIFEINAKNLLKKEDPCLLPKAIKNPTEIKTIKEIHHKDGRALIRFMAALEKQLQEGRILNEIDAAQLLLSFRNEEEDFIESSFETISSVNSNGAIVHYKPSLETAQNLTTESVYLIDSGGQYLGGTTDVTRTLYLGKNPSSHIKQAYTAVLKGHIALAQAIFPKGTTGHQLDALARQYLWKLGLDYDHGTGHGVGCFLNVHEGPQNISKRPVPASLEPGMILSNEPGYYRAEEFGIRIESLLLVVEMPSLSLLADKNRIFYGFETLTLAPIDTKLIEFSNLTPQEKDWLIRYHKRIFDLLGSSLIEEKEWLRKALFENLLF